MRCDDFFDSYFKTESIVGTDDTLDENFRKILRFKDQKAAELISFYEMLKTNSSVNTRNRKIKLNNAISSYLKEADIETAHDFLDANMDKHISGDTEGTEDENSYDFQQGNMEFDSNDTEDSEDGDSEESLDAQDELEDPNTTSFSSEFPEVDEEALIASLYKDFLSVMQHKQCFKIISGYKEEYDNGEIDFTNREFLFGLLKSISSTITHLIIEAEQNVASLVLFERYYDGLIHCMNNIVHATSNDDILTSLEYMINFYNLDDSIELSKD